MFDFWTWPQNPQLREFVFDSPAGERTRVYTCNETRLLRSIYGPRSDVADVTTFGCTNGNLTRITNALGHVRELTAHDAHGRVLAMVDAMASRVPSATTPAAG